MSVINKFLGFFSGVLQNEDSYGRSRRFIPSVLHKIHLYLEHPKNQKMIEIELVNISTSGLAFIKEKAIDKIPFEVGLKVKGELNIDGETLPLDLEIRHQTYGNVGCKIVNDTPEFIRTLENFFMHEIMAHATHLKSSLGDEVFHEFDKKYHLTSDQNHCQLIFEVGKDGILNFMKLDILGNIIHLNQSGDLIYGFSFDERENEQGVTIPDITVQVENLPVDMLNHALRFLEAAPSLPIQTKDLLISHLLQAIRQDQKSKKQAA